MKKTPVIVGAASILAGLAILGAAVIPWFMSDDTRFAVADMDRHFSEQMIPHHHPNCEKELG